MAISITETPRNFALVQSDLIYMASSTNVAEDGFKFVVQVLVGGVEVGKFYIPPNPSGRMVFNARKVLEPYIRTDIYEWNSTLPIHKVNNVFSKCNDGVKEVEVRVGEFFNATEDLNLDNATLFIRSGRSLSKEGYRPNYDAYMRHIEQVYPSWQPFQTERINRFYNPTQTGGFPFASDYFLVHESTDPEDLAVPEIEVDTTDLGVISFVNQLFDIGGHEVSNQIAFRIYNGSTELNTYYVNLTGFGGADPSSTNQEDKVLHVGCFPANFINTVYLASNPTWTHYYVQLTHLFEGGAREWTGRGIKFTRKDYCGKQEMKRIGWTNRWGGWEYQWFEAQTEREFTADRKTYRKLRGDYSGTAMAYTSYEPSEVNYYNDIQQTYKVRHLASKEERQFLESLFASDQVVLFEDDSILPVTVTKRSYTRQGKLSKVFPIEFELKLAYDVNS